MDFLIIFAVLSLIVVFVTAPLRRPGADVPAAEQSAASAAESRLAELEAAREAKYREIRDAELDHRTGKLSDDDFNALDATLRAEAMEILRGLDRADGGQAGDPDGLEGPAKIAAR